MEPFTFDPAEAIEEEPGDDICAYSGGQSEMRSEPESSGEVLRHGERGGCGRGRRWRGRRQEHGSRGLEL
jgi:hypothetical protein